MTMAYIPTPRQRFNSGYHDAQFDAERGTLRRVVAFGQQSPQQVSYSFDWYYAEGYERGVKDFARLGTRLHSSEPAWLDYVSTLVGSEPDALWHETYETEKAQLKDTLRLKKLEPRHLDECRAHANRSLGLTKG